ncbi:ABC transporter substrate-binding protein [Opitutus sp. ER46]|uniref:ABC transporter substrate-binding protein n=1 Tax=Opitutus sp. ER46 TaxID=2161864 RepID=UPI000D314650|nr:ABC transporter substrate-binding protein [Opitutus sp. ER46]PTX92382.1 ABC transporter substrate-binding protein [Opitutus sp. ER46]
MRTARLFALLLLTAMLAAIRLPAAPAVRVVSQTVGADELLLAIAAPDQIAALSHLAQDPMFSAVAEEAKRYPRLDRGDAETVLRYQPTLVLAANYSRIELVEQVRRAGVRVLVFENHNSLEDAYANLLLLARELGPEAMGRAERIIADGRRRVTALEEKLRGVPPVRVISPSVYGVIPGAETTFQDICDHAGAVNLAATLGHLRGHAAPPSEQMLTWPVDKVVVAGTARETALAPFLSLPPYKSMAAVRAHRVALIEPHMISTVTHHRVDAYERLARELHPELFR